jgi:hypothetical protein
MGSKTVVVEIPRRLRGKAVVTGGGGTEARTAGQLGGTLSFAVSEGVIPTNPAPSVRRPAYEVRTIRLSPTVSKNSLDLDLPI